MVIFSFNKSPISKHPRTLNLRKAREQMNKKQSTKKKKCLILGRCRVEPGLVVELGVICCVCVCGGVGTTTQAWVNKSCNITKFNLNSHQVVFS